MVDIVDKVKDFFDGEPEVRRDDNGVYIVAAGIEHRADSLGDLEAKLRGLRELEGETDEETDIARALMVVQNERSRQAGV